MENVIDLFNIAAARSAALTALQGIGALSIALALLRMLRRRLKASISYELGNLYDSAGFYLSLHVRRQRAARFALRRYNRLLLSNDRHRHLHVPAQNEVKLAVDDVFVPFALGQPGREPTPYTPSNILDAGNRIRVIGDPGSGKTTLAKKLLRDECRIGLETPTRARLPIFYELKTCDIPPNADLTEWLYDELQRSVSSNSAPFLSECFEVYACTSGLLVLLDGLDEVSSSQYLRVHAAIQALSNKLHQKGTENAVILTMRTQFHQQVKDDYREFGKVLTIQRFTPSDIFEFLQRWLGKSQQKAIARIFKDLTDRPSLREMCSNPLVLAMYVARDLTTANQGTTESRTEFYRAVTDELVLRRRAAQLGNIVAKSKLHEQRVLVLGTIAYDHLVLRDEPANCLSWKRALEIIEVECSVDSTAATHILRELSKETGLITEERPEETFRFIHLTFCEFFAALEAVQGREDGWHTLTRAHERNRTTGTHTRTRLVEVLPFATGLLGRARREDAMAAVTGLDDWQLLARCLLETKLYEHDGWLRLLSSARRSLSDQQAYEKTPDQWLRDLHLFSVTVQDAEACRTHVPQIRNLDLQEFYIELHSSGRYNFEHLLRAYATQDAAAAFRLAELCSIDLATSFPDIVIASCDQEPFRRLLLDRLPQDGTQARLWAKLLAEAGLRSSLVAHSLASEPAVDAWTKFDTAQHRERWACHGILRPSLYSQALNIGLSDSATHPHMPCLSALRGGPTPSSFWYVPILPYLSLLLLLGALVATLLAISLQSGSALRVGAMISCYGGVVLAMIPFEFYLAVRSGFLSVLYNQGRLPWTSTSLDDLLDDAVRTGSIFSGIAKLGALSPSTLTRRLIRFLMPSSIKSLAINVRTAQSIDD